MHLILSINWVLLFLEKLACGVTGKRGRIWAELILLEPCLPEIENRWAFQRVVCWFCGFVVFVFFILFMTSSLERLLLKYHCGQHPLLSKRSWAGICFRCVLPGTLAELVDKSHTVHKAGSTPVIKLAWNFPLCSVYSCCQPGEQAGSHPSYSNIFSYIPAL